MIDTGRRNYNNIMHLIFCNHVFYPQRLKVVGSVAAISGCVEMIKKKKKLL